MCLLPNLALFSGLCASLIFFHDPFPICSHFLMNCHLSHSIKSVLCTNFSNDGRTGEGKRHPKRRWGKIESPEQGSCNRDIPVGSGTASHLRGQMNHSTPGALGSLGPKQGINNHIRSGSSNSYTAPCQAGFDRSRPALHNYFSDREWCRLHEDGVFQAWLPALGILPLPSYYLLIT